MRVLRSMVIGLVGLWLAAQVPAAAAEQVPVEGFFNQSFGDYQEELQHAREQGKKGILIMFEMDECPFCHRMKATVLNRAEVQRYFQENFLVFSVDIEGDVEVTDFQGRPTTMKDFAFQQFRVRATPVFQFFDLDGQPIKGARYTGATQDADEFLLLGRFVAEGHYRDGNFTKFKRAQKSAPGAG